MGNTEQEIKEIVADLLGVSHFQLSSSTGVGELSEWDSLAQLSIVTALEERYGFTIDPEVMMEIATIADFVQLVENGGSMNLTNESDSLCVTAKSSPVASALFETLPVVCEVMRRAAETPSRAALIFANDSVTYLQLVHGAQAAAYWLQRRGVKRGDTVVVYAEKRKEFYYLYFGAHLLGAAVLNLDPNLKADRRSFICAQTSPCLTVGNVTQTDARYEEVDILTQPPATFTGPVRDDVADIMFTTGTTGEPKGVPLTHENLSAAVRQINEFIGNGKEDVEVLALPVHHSFGMGRARCVLAAGGTLVMVDGFTNTSRLFSLLSDYNATGFAFVPAAWAYIEQMSGLRIAQYATSLRYIEIGSAPMPIEKKRQLMKLFPQARICMHYGLTEASRSTFIEFHSEREHLDSVGKAAPHVDIAVFSESGEQCAPGQEGEICVYGKHVIAHYLGESRQRSRHGKYFRTGDWGVLDEQGYLTILSRTKDIINCGGKKVSPEEVETYLRQLTGIEDCACVPMPDPQGVLGEVVKAVLVGAPSEATTLENIRASLKNNLETYKLPVCVEWRQSLPRTSSGKLMRSSIK